jgi:hypothetical protein
MPPVQKTWITRGLPVPGVLEDEAAERTEWSWAQLHRGGGDSSDELAEWQTSDFAEPWENCELTTSPRRRQRSEETRSAVSFRLSLTMLMLP